MPEVLFLTNSIYPYHLHNVAILSLPFGATYHFRYERQYFHLCSQEIGELEGKVGLLVLRDFDRATFIPLRTLRILKVDDCGGVCVSRSRISAPRSVYDVTLGSTHRLIAGKSSSGNGIAASWPLFSKRTAIDNF